jgi:hypothetical protein
MGNSDTDPLLIRIHPDDNVAVLRRSLGAGESVSVAGAAHRFAEGLGLGHKVALSAIEPGEKIVKFGAPIGSATRPIAPGDHVHLHNMKSDYLPTYTLEEGRRYGGGA